MIGTDKELDRLCEVYGNLDDSEKGKIIMLAEELLHSQRIMGNKKLSEKNESTVFRNKMRKYN